MMPRKDGPVDVPVDGQVDVSSDVTEPKQKPQLFKPGISGNPKGRPVGSRSKLGESFLDRVHVKWEQRGDAALDEAISKEPMQFCKMVAGLLPREFLVKATMQVTATTEVNEDFAQFLSDWRMARQRIGIEDDMIEFDRRDSETSADD
jgi:hypothetical protein